ncbi:hypothetical protein PJIAN_4359 [Paludibacter jiangxiensis]|uniref:Uncharacterized protein n=1 Tax=Paludibacter jiangxiensis TaxID=681398 RepID=A0A161LG74_9BACT|nr:hypothetical protein PJIAN_4359 [Paludibacter jiangxiensis]
MGILLKAKANRRSIVWIPALKDGVMITTESKILDL